MGLKKMQFGEFANGFQALQDDEDSNMSQLAAASQDRLAAMEGRHRAEFEALKQVRAQFRIICSFCQLSTLNLMQMRMKE
jgi:hypothetical protein